MIHAIIRLADSRRRIDPYAVVGFTPTTTCESMHPETIEPGRYCYRCDRTHGPLERLLRIACSCAIAQTVSAEKADAARIKKAADKQRRKKGKP